MKICKVLPDCDNCIVPADYVSEGHDVCDYCTKDLREYELLGICSIGFFRKPMAFLVNPTSGDLNQVPVDLIYDIKNVEDNYFNKEE